MMLRSADDVNQATLPVASRQTLRIALGFVARGLGGTRRFAISRSVHRILTFLRDRLQRLLRGRPVGAGGFGLNAIEYEAVSLIAYEGRKAYGKAREQASYCRRRGSEQGYVFWSQVALEVARRTRGRIPENR